MKCRMVELRCKEVINICDGCRLGFVGDVEVLLPRSLSPYPRLFRQSSESGSSAGTAPHN